MKRTALLVAGLAFVPLAVACGGSGDSEATPPTSESSSADPAASASPEPTPGYGFADYEFTPMTAVLCAGRNQTLGSKDSIRIVIQERVGAIPYQPRCIRDVSRDRLKVTVVNETSNLHNFIVEGDDVELIIQPGSRETATYELTAGPEIDFQCTIHRTMSGAFFR